MDRSSFLASTLTALVAPAVAKPSPSATPYTYDTWDQSPVLPYNRPLEINMDLLDAGKDRFILSHLRGRGVLINIFATWCPPCNHEQPFLVEAAARYASKGLSIIGINSEEDDDKVRAYRKKYGVTYPIAMDRHGGFTENIEVGATGKNEEFPVSLFITPTGYLYGMLQGGMSGDDLDYRIEKFLSAVAADLRSPDALTKSNN